MYSQPADITENHKYPPLIFILFLIKVYLSNFPCVCAFVRLKSSVPQQGRKLEGLSKVRKKESKDSLRGDKRDKLGKITQVMETL